MPSDQQVAANQMNAKKTGPRSKTGREISRRNALRYGLAINVRADPAVHDDIEKLANVLSSSDETQDLCENARVAAEAQFICCGSGESGPGCSRRYTLGKPAGSDGLTKLNDELAKLERYERRAFSRRKRALRLMSYSCV
jgi:hypothetical protein